MKPYNLLAVDPGSENSALLDCRVEPPEEWALPFGVMPQQLLHEPNAVARQDIRVAKDYYDHIAVEFLRGIYVGAKGKGSKGPRVLGRDQLAAQFWAGQFCGASGLGASRQHLVTRSTATSVVCEHYGGKAKGDAAVRAALIDIYGGEAKAVGGGRCKTCKKAEGWIGRGHADCPNCKGGHGDTGYERPRGPFYAWTGSHGFAALAVAIVAAQRIGRRS